jgi:hypothetical protein
MSMCSPSHSGQVKTTQQPAPVYGPRPPDPEFLSVTSFATISTDSAEVEFSSCSPASSVLRCVRLPRSFMNWTYGISPSPAHATISICTLFFCSSFPSEQSHLRCNRRFFFLDSPIPALNEEGFSGLSILEHEVSTHAKVLRLRRVLPQLADNAVVNIAFPTKQQGRHPKEVISELNAREACLRFPLTTHRPLCCHNHRVERGQGDYLSLPGKELSSSTSCRF